jgi:glycosyltransferase involved in cell wall biosynthesis
LSTRYDVVITGSERPSLIFALLQHILRRKRVPHIFIECLWILPRGYLKRWRRRTLLRWVAQGAARIVVHARRQVEAYEKAFDIAPGKFVFLRCQSSLYGACYPVNTGDYIFAGGDSGRDYATLIEAVRDLPCRVMIAALRRDHFRGLTLPANVQIVTLDPERFNLEMAGARLVAVSLQRGLLHSGGHQGFENAMTLGKAVVVADDWAEDYIEDGTTGVLVPAGSAGALRTALSRLLDDPELVRLIGEKAKGASTAFAPEVFFEGVFRLVDECLQKQS